MTAKETKRKSGSSWFYVWGVLILGLWSEPELKDGGLHGELSDVLEVESRIAAPLRLYHNTRPLKICEEWSPGPEELSLIHEYECWIFSNVISFFKEKKSFFYSQMEIKLTLEGGAALHLAALRMIHFARCWYIIHTKIRSSHWLFLLSILLPKFCGMPYIRLAFILTVIPITRTKLYFSCRAVGESETSNRVFAECNAGFCKNCQILAFSVIWAAILSRELWSNKR